MIIPMLSLVIIGMMAAKCIFSKEAKGFEPENLELSYFVEKPALPYKDVKNEIECALGLFVTNMATDADQQGKKRH